VKRRSKTFGAWPGRYDRPARGVVFDLDGTLLDSNDAHAMAWVQAFAACGFPASFRSLRPLVGKSADQMVPDPIGVVSQSREWRRVVETHREIFHREHLSGLRSFPGARELVERLRAEGHMVAVAGWGGDGDLEVLLEATGLSGLFDAHVTADTVARPDQGLVGAALALLQVDPREAVAVGDTPYDVAAASRSGVRSIGLRSGGWPDDAFDSAVAVFDDVADLYMSYDEVPLFHAEALAAS
jgi:HAD superfamily hydrolase (TIGR01509 family)